VTAVQFQVDGVNVGAAPPRPVGNTSWRGSEAFAVWMLRVPENGRVLVEKNSAMGPGRVKTQKQEKRREWYFSYNLEFKERYESRAHAVHGFFSPVLFARFFSNNHDSIRQPKPRARTAKSLKYW
jgi:hypothetical protein